MAILAKKLARLVINDGNLAGDIDKDETDEPKIPWREWRVALLQTLQGDYTLVKSYCKKSLAAPYDEQSQDVEDKTIMSKT